jgi:hypothetical protein
MDDRQRPGMVDLPPFVLVAALLWILAVWFAIVLRGWFVA